ncbi:DUF1657 domain-containing protein [Siminovitchia sediminis]|uniref:DUF1657 domain-containing protein n=1 Tax=Siminovitchia sediminis TaxID=1274353 RepID=A0ABW4KD31_9BACI
MTVLSDVKTTLATIKGIQATFSKLALVSTDEKAKAVFHECMIETEPVISDLQQRIERMMEEEIQYKNS